MVTKIESVTWHRLTEQAGDGLIEIELRDLFTPYLLGDSYCDSVTIWWESDTDEYSESVIVFAIEDMSSVDGGERSSSRVKYWYEPELLKAMCWVIDNLH